MPEQRIETRQFRKGCNHLNATLRGGVARNIHSQKYELLALLESRHRKRAERFNKTNREYCVILMEEKRRAPSIVCAV